MISLLRQKRFFSQMSIHALGKVTQIDPAKISLIERGYKIPKENEKEKIASALKCKVYDIFPAEEEN